MMKRFGIVFICIVGVFSLSYLKASAYVFSQSLSVGQTHPDVRELQRILNKDPLTIITLSGGGAPGLETAFFGQLTYKAVVKFQAKYGILATGFVGPLTRAKLTEISSNTAQNNASTVVLPSQTTQTTLGNAVTDAERINIYETDAKIKAFQDKITAEINAAIEQKRVPDVSFTQNVGINAISPVITTSITTQAAVPGTKVTIGGLGFDTKNSVYVGPNYIIRDTTSTGSNLSFTVPAIPAGRYDLVIKNNKGISNTLFFIVKAENSPNVTISSINPQKVAYGDTITISGSGFTATNNEVATSFGNMKGIASEDGRTLKIAYKPEQFRAIATLGKQNRDQKIDITVINSNGFNKIPISFTFTY